MARRVPLGMAVVGSFKSPLMFAPATMPVTAGKKTAKTLKKLWLSPDSSLNVYCCQRLLSIKVPLYPTKPLARSSSLGSRKVPTTKSTCETTRRARRPTWTLVTQSLPTMARIRIATRPKKRTFERSKIRAF